ncbi:MAG TPA: PAS domain S-box protein [Burkholderiales bacterium]|nr:PAS domain S-box protein [Burkholderiales bacterium]
MTGSKRLEALQEAALAVSSARGERIFEDLARSLAKVLHCDTAFLGQTAGEYMQVVGGHGTPHERYRLAGSACADVLKSGFLLVADGAGERYGPDGFGGFVGYAGYRLNDPAGSPTGVLAVLSRRPLINPGIVESVLKIFAVRAEAELERRTHEAAMGEQYRAMFNAAADSLVLRDADFRVVDVNPAYEAMSGRRREEVVGRDVLTMSPHSLNDHVRELHARALAGEKVQFESHARRKDGSRFHIETRGVPIRHRGEPHVLYIGRDITERRVVEQQLRASEEQYRAIFNAAADALVLRDADFRIVDVNPAYVSLSGYAREEVLGRQHVVANPPEVEARIRELHARALAGEPVMLETRRISKSGGTREVELRGVPIMFRGEPHVLYIGRDISERKRGEQALRDSEEQYRAIFNAAADALVLRDDTGRVVDVNAAFCAISGYSREEVLSERRWIFARSDLSALAAEMHRRVIAGESVQFEIQAVRKDGTPLDIEMRAVPMVYRGKPHALGMARDITARKRAEAERAGLEAQLRQAQKMEALGHLTGGIAHDFNNLLASIMGHVVLAIERNPGDAKLARYLDQSLASARKARDLIKQMLTFSRGQRGTPRVVSLGQAVEESLKLLRGSLPSTVEIATCIDPVETAVMVDPVQLDQVVLNLAINARDAMAGAGHLTVSVRSARATQAVCASCRQPFDGSFVELAVGDSGPGVAPEVLERMFEPFFTTKEVGRGSGMGLATVHGVVHEHGGHIVVDTSAPRGGLFRILLPALAAGTEAKPLEAPKARGQREPLRGRILVVDDEAPVAEFLRELLESWGISARAVTSPAAALEVFGAEAYDLVITDQTMPGTTGFRLARELLARRPGLPVILCTGHIDEIASRELESAGIRGLLHKPVEPDELYGLLRAQLN